MTAKRSEVVIRYPTKESDEPAQAGDMAYLTVPESAPDWVTPTGWTRNGLWAYRLLEAWDLPLEATVYFIRPTDAPVMMGLFRPVPRLKGVRVVGFRYSSSP